jgi:hypothetical protein
MPANAGQALSCASIQNREISAAEGHGDLLVGLADHELGDDPTLLLGKPPISRDPLDLALSRAPYRFHPPVPHVQPKR